MVKEEVSLVPIALEHAPAIQTLIANPLIAATTRIPHPYPENGAVDFITQTLQEQKTGKTDVFAIKWMDTVVGACGLHLISATDPYQREVGYWIGQPYWGKGIATTAIGLLLQFAFKTLKLQKVTAGVLETNQASRRVIEKNRFQWVGYRARNDPKLNPYEKLACYELSANHWLRASSEPS